MRRQEDLLAFINQLIQYAVSKIMDKNHILSVKKEKNWKNLKPVHDKAFEHTRHREGSLLILL